MSEIKEPPRQGAGSGRAAWAAYADQLGVSYPAGASRADIMGRVNQARTTVAAVPEQAAEALPPYVATEPEPEVATAPAVPAAPEMVFIIPSRGRPESVARVTQAWLDTHAFDAARMLWVLDVDDPTLPEYQAALAEVDPASTTPVPEGYGAGTRAGWIAVIDDATGMVPKSNLAARGVAADPSVYAIGWAGDDHLPRTEGWAQRYLAELHDLGTGIVYGDDLIEGKAIPTQWAMTADIVRTIGRLIPALVRHLYSDNAVGALGEAAGCLRYLPDVVVEHLHPRIGKASWDDQYRRMNSKAQYANDRATFERWRKRPANHPRAGLASQAAKIRALRG